MELNQVTLPTKNMKQSVDFYLKMGFTQIVDTPHYARFQTSPGGSSFSLSLTQEPIESGITVYFEERELDAWVNRLQSRGIEFQQMPTNMRYLWREAILLDPAGNKLKLYWAGENRLNPPWRIEKKLF